MTSPNVFSPDLPTGIGHGPFTVVAVGNPGYASLPFAVPLPNFTQVNYLMCMSAHVLAKSLLAAARGVYGHLPDTMNLSLSLDRL